jgi:hypothetical protein
MGCVLFFIREGKQKQKLVATWQWAHRVCVRSNMQTAINSRRSEWSGNWLRLAPEKTLPAQLRWRVRQRNASLCSGWDPNLQLIYQLLTWIYERAFCCIYSRGRTIHLHTCTRWKITHSAAALKCIRASDVLLHLQRSSRKDAQWIFMLSLFSGISMLCVCRLRCNN